jgi:regulatory protein
MLSSVQTTERRGSRGDARAFVASSLAAKAQSVAEIQAKLAARGVDADEADAAVSEVLRLGFLDDAELAGQLTRGFRARGYGSRRAEVALRRRGIPAPLAARALEEAYRGADEAQLARRALRSRRVDDPTAQRRAVGFLLRRGFSASAAWSAVRSSQPP